MDDLTEVVENELGAWGDWSVELVLDAVPDGWAKVDGEWITLDDLTKRQMIAYRADL